MRIVILALGSRGDVQPYLALGKGLQAAGHRVRIITHEDYIDLAHTHGLETWAVEGNIQEFAESPEMRRRLEQGSFISVMRYAAQAAERAAVDWAKAGWQACQGMDLIVAGFGGMFIGLAIAEKLDLPLLQAHYVPFTPTGVFPGALFPPGTTRLGSLANRISHHLTRQMMWQQIRSADTAARRKVLGLPSAPFWGPFQARALEDMPILYGFSPAVIAKPADWSEKVHITGYWYLDSDPAWEPSPELEAFLSDGQPPIYIGFGSMSSRKPEETAFLILQALAQSRQRAVLLSGWDGIKAERLPHHVFLIDSAPHDWLFARVAAVVHHGGAGTTAAGLRAGLPSVIVPFFADQPFWGQRVAHLGAGPAPIPRKKLTVEKLSRAIDIAVTDQDMQRRANRLGERIRAEDGIGRAVAVIERVEKGEYI